MKLGNRLVQRKPPSSPNPKRIRRESEEVVQVFLNFFPKMITWHNESDSDSESEEDIQTNTEDKAEFIIDSGSYGNISRFFNVSFIINFFELF